MKVNESKPSSTLGSSEQNVLKQEQNIIASKVELKYIQNTYLFLNNDNLFSTHNQLKKQYNLTYLKQCLIEEQQLVKADLLELIARFKNVIKNQENLVKINGNVTVIGDIHGQFYDFVKVLSLVKLKYIDLFQKLTSGNLLFLGDYVDRGYYSIQVMTLMMALKVNNPNKVFCLRGNHECRAMTVVYNFKAQNIVKYDQQVYEAFMEVFDMLPIAAVINNSFFCVHGGISDQLMDIEKINQINRFSQIPQQGPFCDFIWSDPAPKNRQKMYEQAQFNDTRMCSIFYGKKLTNKFIQNNKLKTIIRAHQVFPEGFQRRDWNTKNKGVPSVITIFSAPNYCGMYGNLGAILHIKNNTLQVRQYKQEPLTKRVKTFLQVFEWSMPQIIRIINEFSKNMMKSLGIKYLQHQFPKYLQAPYDKKLSFLLDYYKNYRNNQDNKNQNIIQNKNYVEQVKAAQNSPKRLISYKKFKPEREIEQADEFIQIKQIKNWQQMQPKQQQ